eukprot:559741-Pleurochrysis_carterae.AAC.1
MQTRPRLRADLGEGKLGVAQSGIRSKASPCALVFTLAHACMHVLPIAVVEYFGAKRRLIARGGAQQCCRAGSVFAVERNEMASLPRRRGPRVDQA